MAEQELGKIITNSLNRNSLRFVACLKGYDGILPSRTIAAVKAFIEATKFPFL
jgi:hypothetical protein